MRISFGVLFLFFIVAGCSNSEDEPDQKIIPSEKPEKKMLFTEKDSIGVFKWETDMCRYENTFNTRIYSLEELKGTLELLNMVGGLMLEVNSSAFTPDQITELSTLEELDNEYRKKRNALQKLEIVQDPFWQDVKRLMLREMKDEYDLDRIGIRAYTDPNALKGNRFSHVCPDIVAALTGNDTALVISKWRELVEEQCKNNASPDYLLKRFETESTSPDRMMYARVKLITFGWHNRVNATIRDLAHDEELNRKFDRLFLKTHVECDEC